MPTEIPSIFLSYARADSAFVLKLAKALRSAGTNLWLDQVDIRGGDVWERAVEDALKTSSCLLVVLSPAAVASTNVTDEVSFALDNKKKIVPIVYRQCDIPFRLRRLQYIDFTVDYTHGLTQLLTALNAGVSASGVARSAACWINVSRLTYLLVAALVAAVIGISYWMYDMRADAARTMSVQAVQRKNWHQVSADLQLLIRSSAKVTLYL
jgi:hypothetical protein